MPNRRKTAKAAGGVARRQRRNRGEPRRLLIEAARDLFNRKGYATPQDVMPATYAELPGPVHVLGLVAMGMPLIDNCDLEELASVCAELRRWEFQLMVAPLRIVGGSGSPVNPIAVF